MQEDLDIFQRRGLRQILGLDTTWGQMKKGEQRKNDNLLIIEMANQALNKNQIKKLDLLCQIYNKYERSDL